MSDNSRNSYSSIFKAIGLFGGVRVFQIIISILRAKLIAMLIGPAGMGISNLLKSTADMINHVTGCGLQTSAVRDVAKSYNTEDEYKISRTIIILRHLVWFTGFLGVAVVFFGSGLLSKFVFGNDEYTTAFRILSIMMLFMQINVGQMALLQGTFHYKDIAKSTFYGHLLSLLLTIPIYYYWREDGIVPALVIASLITFFYSWFYSRKIKVKKVKLTISDVIRDGKGMMTLGIVLALGGLIGNLSSYVMNVFLAHAGSFEIVGFYSAGTTIANSYVFMVMSAMSSDYVPRLSALSDDNKGQIEAINKQVVLVALILTPLLVAFMIYSKLAVYVLYTEEFYAITTMLELLMFGIMFQAITWCLSYAIVARGESKLFLLTEIYNFVISVALKIGGFWLWGLAGIGIGFIADYLFELILIWYVCRWKFNFKLSSESKRIFVLSLIICFGALVVALSTQGVFRYTIGSMALLCALYFAFHELDKRTNFVAAIKKIKR